MKTVLPLCCLELVPTVSPGPRGGVVGVGVGVASGGSERSWGLGRPGRTSSASSTAGHRLHRPRGPWSWPRSGVRSPRFSPVSARIAQWLRP